MINTMCSKRSNYTIIESLIFRFLFFDHTNNFSNTHISRPLLYISDYFFSLSFCRYVMLLLHVKSKSLIIFHQKRFDSWSVFGHDIKNIHEQQTDEVWDGMIQTRSCYSIFFLEIWIECPYFICNGWSYLSKCTYKIEFHSDQYHSYNEKSEICKYLMCDKHNYNLAAF